VSGPGAPVPAVARASGILEWVASCGRPASLTEIADVLALPKSSTLAICRTLVAERLLERDAVTGGYRLGPQILALSQAYIRNLDLAQAFLRVVETVPDAREETVQLALLDGASAVYVAKRDGVRRVAFQRIGAELGQRLPASCSSTGRSMLAYLTEEEVRALYRDAPLPRMTDRSPATLDELLDDLARIRRRGYAVDREAVIEGLACVGAAVFGPDTTRPTAAVSAVLFSARLDADLEGRLGAAMRTIAARLSEQMGHRPA
jgi:IclR family transcriptional regulator, blcABC operon repressor